MRGAGKLRSRRGAPGVLLGWLRAVLQWIVPPPVVDERRFWTAHDGGGRSRANGLEAVDLEDGRVVEDEASRRRGGQAFFNPLGSAQAYFRIERPHRLGNRDLEIEVELASDVPLQVRIDYDSIDHEVRVVDPLPGAFKRTPEQPLAPAPGWQRLRFLVADARFHRSVNTADFRIVSSQRHGPLHVRSVLVEPSGPCPPGRPAGDDRGTGGRLAFPRVEAPEVSIVVPVWNRLDMTLECLRALGEHTHGSFEVVVVDNGSTPLARTRLGWIPNLRIVRHDENLGYARACNAGARVARGRYVLFLNNDTLPLDGWLPPLVAAAEADPRVKVVGSLLVYPDTGEVQHAGVDIGEQLTPTHRFRFRPVDAPEVRRDAVVPAITGACLLTSRDLFLELGGFDECFVNGFEDVDFCLRVAEAGGRCHYCAKSVLLHHESATPGRLDPERERANLRRLHERWRGRVREASPITESPGGSAPGRGRGQGPAAGR